MGDRMKVVVVKWKGPRKVGMPNFSRPNLTRLSGVNGTTLLLSTTTRREFIEERR